jgi:hypothetical protein
MLRAFLQERDALRNKPGYERVSWRMRNHWALYKVRPFLNLFEEQGWRNGSDHYRYCRLLERYGRM